MSDEQRRKGLGRGLSALLEEDPQDQATLERLRTTKPVAIEQLEPSPYQPRRYFDEDELQGLVDSIVENGILQPILVRRHPEAANRYQIVAGERRWRAAQLASLHEVPIVLRELSDSQALELAIIENVQRQDLSAIEEAEGYRRLLDEFGHTQEQLGRVVGKSRSHVANTLRLMNLPEEVRSLVHRGDISAGHARALLVAEDPVALAKQVMAEGLNVRQTEKLVQAPRPPAERAPAKGKDADTVELEKQLSERLGLKVVISHKGEAGQVLITYRSLEQFDEIFNRLTHAPANSAAMLDPEEALSPALQAQRELTATSGPEEREDISASDDDASEPDDFSIFDEDPEEEEPF